MTPDEEGSPQPQRTGWSFRRFSTPVSGTRQRAANGSTSAGRRAGPSRLLILSLAPIGLCLVLGQILLSRRFGNVPEEKGATLTNFVIEEPGKVVDDDVGYLAVTIPSHVLEILQDEKDSGDDTLDDEEVKLFLEEALHDVKAESLNSTEEDRVEDLKLFQGFRKLAKYPTLSPTPAANKKVCNVMPENKTWDSATAYELIWSYSQDEKALPYVGSDPWLARFLPGTRQYLNSAAVFPFFSAGENNETMRQHGLVGVYPNCTQAWSPHPMPPPITSVTNRTEAMRRGGFYLDLVNALPMDRASPEHRDPACLKAEFDYANYEDVSIIITFYNEPLGTLLRSVHSVLNHTPPPLLREIILVDDFSSLAENLPGGPLYEYVKLLPKTGILRLAERRGLVWARLAGAIHAKAPIYVVLDSHIEVNRGWLDYLVMRIKESPKSIVFPQIMALDADTLEYNRHSGIGASLSFKWNMVEEAHLTSEVKDLNVIPSPSMAGGLFAVHSDWFWEIGGYDEGFSMWGSENVEMGFRTWLCGGRLEGVPCSRTFHIYRKEGFGYTSPFQDVIRNKLRTARVWTDEWYELAKIFSGDESRIAGGVGNLDQMLELKERLKCKPFKWFLENVDPGHRFSNMESIQFLGELSNVKFPKACLDALNHNKAGEEFGVFGCHGQRGNQGFLKDFQVDLIHSLSNEKICLAWKEGKPIFEDCRQEEARGWSYTEHGQLQKKSGNSTSCLTFVETYQLAMEDCNAENLHQQWKSEKFVPAYEPPTFSPEYQARKALIHAMHEEQYGNDSQSRTTSSSKAPMR